MTPSGDGVTLRAFAVTAMNYQSAGILDEDNTWDERSTREKLGSLNAGELSNLAVYV